MTRKRIIALKQALDDILSNRDAKCPEEFIKIFKDEDFNVLKSAYQKIRSRDKEDEIIYNFYSRFKDLIGPEDYHEEACVLFFLSLIANLEGGLTLKDIVLLLSTPEKVMSESTLRNNWIPRIKDSNDPDDIWIQAKRLGRKDYYTITGEKQREWDREFFRKYDSDDRSQIAISRITEVIQESQKSDRLRVRDSVKTFEAGKTNGKEQALIRNYCQNLQEQILRLSSYDDDGNILIVEQGIIIILGEREGFQWSSSATFVEGYEWGFITREEILVGLEKGNHCLLQGEMGLGKTLLLVELVLKQLDKLENPSSLVVPFFIPLRDLDGERLRDLNKRQILEELLLQAVKRIYNFKESFEEWQTVINLLINNGNFILFLDGLDEYSGSKKSFDPASLFIEDYPCGMILTSRPNQAQSVFRRSTEDILKQPESGKWNYLKLESFTRGQVITYLEKSIKNIEGFNSCDEILEELEKRFPRRKSFSEEQVAPPYHTIPLFLYGITQYFKRKKGEIPPSIEDLFEEMFIIQLDWFFTQLIAESKSESPKPIPLHEECSPMTFSIEIDYNTTKLLKVKEVKVKPDSFFKFLYELISKLSMLALQRYLLNQTNQQAPTLYVLPNEFLKLVDKLLKKQYPLEPKDSFKQLLLFALESNEFVICKSPEGIYIAQVRMMEYFSAKEMVVNPMKYQLIIDKIIGNLSFNVCRNIASIWQELFIKDKVIEDFSRFLEGIIKRSLVEKDRNPILVLFDKFFTKEPERFLEALDTTRHKVTGINLRGRGICKLPEELAELSYIKVLDLSNNYLTHIPSLDRLTELEELYLNNNQLDDLPRWIGDLSNLKILNIGKNRFKELPIEIMKLKNLQQFYLRYNDLEELPETLGNLNTLTTLHLDSNELTSLPEAFGKLINLQSLSFWNNKLGKLCESFGQLINLRYLDLGRNNLNHLPPDFERFLNIQLLGLQENKFKTLPPVLIQLRALRTLKLHDNELCKSSIPEMILLIQSLKQLEMFNLSGNVELNPCDKNWFGKDIIKELLTCLQEVDKLDVKKREGDEPKVRQLIEYLDRLERMEKLSIRNVIDKSWEYSRIPQGKGKPRVVARLKLIKNNRIIDLKDNRNRKYNYANEDRWELIDGKLHFIHADGHPYKIFEDIRVRDDGKLIMRGHSKGKREKGRISMLTEI
ncbi:MAG: leucine-rich repeat domain-containing protein [Candidatus Hermodarchaeota archaeon]